MMIRYSRPVSHAARMARRVGMLAFLLALAALVAHRFGFLETPAFVLFVLASAGMAAVAVALALVGLQRLWQVGAEAGVAAIKALAFSLLPLGLVGGAALLAATTPPVADVSTDHLDRPEWLVAPSAHQSFLPRRDSTLAGRAAELAAYPELTGRRYDGALDRVYRAVTKVAEAEHVAITARQGVDNPVDLEDTAVQQKGKDGAAPAEDEDKATVTPEIGPIPRERPEPNAGFATPRADVVLQGEERTLILGLPFDLLIRLREDAETTTVDIRVSARYGSRDLGFSADIARSYLSALDAELLGTSGD